MEKDKKVESESFGVSFGVPEGYDSEAGRKFREENLKRYIERKEAMKSPELKALEQQLEDAKRAGDKRRVETLKYRIKRLEIQETYKDCSEDMINLHLGNLSTQYTDGKFEAQRRFNLMVEQEHYDRHIHSVKYPSYVQHYSSAPPTSPYKREKAKVSRFDRASTRRAAGCYVPNE